MQNNTISPLPIRYFSKNILWNESRIYRQIDNASIAPPSEPVFVKVFVRELLPLQTGFSFGTSFLCESPSLKPMFTMPTGFMFGNFSVADRILAREPLRCRQDSCAKTSPLQTMFLRGNLSVADKFHVREALWIFRDIRLK